MRRGDLVRGAWVCEKLSVAGLFWVRLRREGRRAIFEGWMD